MRHTFYSGIREHKAQRMLEKIIGIAAGIFTATALLPQLVKIIKEKCADNTATGMVLVLLTGLSLWVWYGILKEDWPIIITNSFSVLVNLTILILKKVYSK